MKKILLGILLVLFVVGCQQQATTKTTNTDSEAATQDNEPDEPAEVSTPPEVVDGEPMAREEPTDIKQYPNSDSVIILGKDGFDPEELTIKAGTTVEFLNQDEKIIVLTFQKQGSRVFDNSDQIANGATYEKTFDESGEYDYWSLAYGVKAKIIVE